MHNYSSYSPHYYGDPLEWKTFYDSFLHMIDESPIPDIKKFSYLKTYLKGTAEETISGITLTDANYKTALSLLTKRFGDDQVLITSHMNTLLKIDPIKSMKECPSLRGVYDLIEAQIRSLQTLGITSKEYGPMLIPILQSKFPEELNLHLSRNMGRGTWDIDIVLEVLCKEIEARERLFTGSEISKLEQPYTASAM